MDPGPLQTEFKQQFPEAGSPFVCRVPGRINLLGEHLDYNGLPVLPMAIDREIQLAFAGRRDATVRICNLDARFPEIRFENVPAIPPSSAGAWDNYCKAALHGLNDHFQSEAFPGFDGLIQSDLPTAAGLSSSSALVVATALAYLGVSGYTLDRDISRRDLARVLANAEHYVGTAGGGMDQAILLNAEAGHATKINFIPFQFESLPLPDEMVLLVCDSLVPSEKTGDALAKYNAGPAVCSLMTNMLNVHFARNFGEEFSIDCLGDLWFGPLCFNRGEVRKLFDEVFAEPLVTPTEVIQFLGMNPALVREYWLNSIPLEGRGIPLQARARHVFSEYYRVEEARDALLVGDMESFGRLMDASHQSCASDYGISTAELDFLAETLREGGCLGARLTGAGFGGAVIGLVARGAAPAALEAVKRRYYLDYLGYTDRPPAFAVRASQGASYL